MKYFILAFSLFLAISGFAQVKKFTNFESGKSLISKHKQRSEFVLDRTNTFIGNGTGWTQDGTEWTLTRDAKGLPLTIEADTIYFNQTYKAYLAELSYHDNDSLFEYKLRDWSGSAWSSDYVYYEQYRSDGQPVETRDGWYATRELYFYNSENQKIEKREQDDYGTWVDFSSTLYMYDAGKLIQEEYRQNVSEAWESRILTTHTYTDGLLTESLTNYVLEDWMTNVIYEYDANNFLLTATVQGKTESTNWEDFSKTTYRYDHAGRITEHAEIDLSDAAFSTKDEYTYDEFGNERTRFIYENSDDWSLFYKGFDEYDANLNISKYYTQVKNESGVFVNFDKYEYSWSEILDVEDIKNQVVIHPNPTTDILTLSGIESSECVEIFIIDLTGKTVYQKKSVNDHVLDIRNLQSGLYFLRIKTAKTTKTGKFIKN